METRDSLWKGIVAGIIIIGVTIFLGIPASLKQAVGDWWYRRRVERPV